MIPAFETVDEMLSHCDDFDERIRVLKSEETASTFDSTSVCFVERF